MRWFIKRNDDNDNNTRVKVVAPVVVLIKICPSLLPDAMMMILMMEE